MKVLTFSKQFGRDSQYFIILFLLCLLISSLKFLNSLIIDIFKWASLKFNFCSIYQSFNCSVLIISSPASSPAVNPLKFSLEVNSSNPLNISFRTATSSQQSKLSLISSLMWLSTLSSSLLSRTEQRFYHMGIVKGNFWLMNFKLRVYRFSASHTVICLLGYQSVENSSVKMWMLLLSVFLLTAYLLQF
jgi:hypothetical protein